MGERDLLEQLDQVLETVTPGEWFIRNMPGGNLQFEGEGGKVICQLVPPIPIGDFAMFGMAKPLLERSAKEIRRLQKEVNRLRNRRDRLAEQGQGEAGR